MPGEAVEKEMTCIVCPNGCRLAVRRAGDQITVKGNLCPKGIHFARDELTHPARSLTTTVRILGAALPVLSARLGGNTGAQVRAQAGALSGYVLDSLRGLREALQYHQGDNRLAGVEERTDGLLHTEERL